MPKATYGTVAGIAGPISRIVRGAVLPEMTLSRKRSSTPSMTLEAIALTLPLYITMGTLSGSWAVGSSGVTSVMTWWSLVKALTLPIAIPCRCVTSYP